MSQIASRLPAGEEGEMSWEGKYGLRIIDSVYFGFFGQYEEANRCHTLVSDYLDSHPQEHSELLYPNGHCKYYEVLKKAMTSNEWTEFMKPKPWDKGIFPAPAPGEGE